MSLIRNNRFDVRKHLHLVGAASEPDATGFSGDGPASTEPNAHDPVSQSAAGINLTIDHPSDGLLASAVTQKPQA
jgi:hypothetical protein